MRDAVKILSGLDAVQKIIPKSWGGAVQILNQVFPNDTIDNISVKLYPWLEEDGCKINVVVFNSNAQIMCLDMGLAESVLDEYFSDIRAEYEILERCEEEANRYKFIVKIVDFDNFLSEKVSVAKNALGKLGGSADKLKKEKYSCLQDDFPGWNNSYLYATAAERVPVDCIVGEVKSGSDKWTPSAGISYREAVKRLALGRAVCDSNPIRLVRIRDNYYVCGDGYNRVCAAKYLGLEYISAMVDSYDYDNFCDNEELSQVYGMSYNPEI